MLKPTDAYAIIRLLVHNHDDIVDMITATLDDEPNTIDDRPEIVALLHTICDDRDFALSIVNQP